MTTFLIGHVTKTGDLAGPRVLEHLVDTVLEFEGDKQHGYRILRSVKNRFGSTDDLVIFEMGGEGLKEVANPSKLFLEERQREVPGSAIAGTVEGSRAYLVEVQALIAQSSYPNPTRKSTGLDQNRLALLLAVIEKTTPLPALHPRCLCLGRRRAKNQRTSRRSRDFGCDCLVVPLKAHPG